VLVAAAYFLAARLGLALLIMPGGVAAFWPAAGVAAGTMIALGPRARWPVALGAVAATVAANLMGDRNLWSSAVFGLCNAGEAFLAAALIEYRFGPRFDLDSLRHVLSLLGLAMIAAGISGIGGTLGYVLFHTSDAPVLRIWEQWFASDTLGIAAVAPVLIGLASLCRNPPSRTEFIEGIAALSLLTLVGAFGIFTGRGPWTTVVPVALTFPLLLWLAARCPPVFAAAASFMGAFAIVWTTTFGLGFFGTLALKERISGAQAGVLSVLLCALVLAALFAERRQQAAALGKSEARLQDALTVGAVIAFEWERGTGAVQRSGNAGQILGFDPQHPLTSAEFLRHVHPDHREQLMAAIYSVNPECPSYTQTFRFACPDGREVWLEEIAKAEFDSAGRHMRLTGLTRDITEAKRVDEILRSNEERLRHALEAGQIATWERDDRKGIVVWNDQYYRLLGYKIREVMPSRAAWLDRVHPEDRLGAKTATEAAESGLRDYISEFRIFRPDGSLRWARACGRFLNNAGEPLRTIGVVEDITEAREQIETQRVLVAELQHRTRNLMAVVQSIAHQTLSTTSSLEDFENRFNQRLEALSRVQGLLSRASDQPITIAALVAMELDALGSHARSGRIQCGGPVVRLRKSAVEMLALAIHELATNAIKYGALASNTGRLSVTWRFEGARREGNVVLEWIEDGIASQPCARQSQHGGYGRTLIEQALPYSLAAETKFELGANILRCAISLPPSAINGGGAAVT
jgi:PAS domain S-box-containing protein